MQHFRLFLFYKGYTQEQFYFTEWSLFENVLLIDNTNSKGVNMSPQNTSHLLNQTLFL